MLKNVWRLFTVLILILSSFSTKGQYYDAGHEPASTKWRIIKAGQFDLIYPDTMELRAQQLAQYLDSVVIIKQSLYRKPLRRVPVVLHNSKTISNAFVGWAPSRMEFYTVPPPTGYGHDWLEQLAIHESTHWFQFSQIYQGLTGVLARIFGEHIAAGVFGLYVPFWVIEGDAVYNETAFSESGRGRDAEFEQLLRTRLVTAGPWHYDKAAHGSFRDLTANHYELGYQLVAYGRQRYGDLLWDSVYRHVARNPYNPMAFNGALKRQTGLSKTEFYREGMEQMRQQWKTLNSFRKPAEGVTTIAGSENWTRYRYPIVLPDGRIISEKLSLDDIRSLAIIDTSGTESRLFYPGITIEAGYNIAGDRLYYSAWSRHPRWPNIEYSDIRYYSLSTGKNHRVTTGERYFSPAADPATGDIFAARYNEQHQHSLVKMLPDGTVISECMLPAGLTASHLSWWKEHEHILFTGINAHGKAFYTWDGFSDPERVTPYTRVNIDFPRGAGRFIVFQGDFDGVNDIFLYDPAERANYRVTRSQFGAVHPYADTAGNVYYSELRESGAALCMVPQQNILMERLEFPSRPAGFVNADRLMGGAPLMPSLDTMCDTCYHSSRYRSYKQLFRFHSWAPAAIDPDQTSVQPGVSIFSQNTLSTAFFNTGFRYDVSTLDREYYSDFIYKGFLPQINLSYSFAEPYYKSTDTTIADFRYERHSAGLSLSLPLYSTAQQWSNYFNAELGFYHLSFVHKPETHPNFIIGGLNYGYFRLYAHRLRRSSVRDLYPKWGQVIDITAISTATGSIDAGYVIGVRSVSYLPGIFKNHGIRLYLGAQKRESGADLSFNRLVTTPRGFRGMMLNDAAAFQFNYSMPLWYPDLNLGPLIYIKRLSITGFFDAISGNHPDMEPGRYSYGFELSSDVHLLRHFAPVTMGYGLALPSEGKPFHYFLFKIEFTL